MLSRNVIVNVFKSDAVIWWAAIFRRIPHYFCERPVKAPSFLVRNFYLECPSDMQCKRWVSGKEIFWSQTSRSWKILDASEIPARRLNTKDTSKQVITPKKCSTGVCDCFESHHLHGELCALSLSLSPHLSLSLSSCRFLSLFTCLSLSLFMSISFF